MRGRPPKDPSVRQRRNKVPPTVELPADEPSISTGIPALPSDREWHEETIAWWNDLWESPMAHAFITFDRRPLLILAVLVDSFWKSDSTSEQRALAGEIRQHSDKYGLTPLDRRRADWKIKSADEKPLKAAPEPVAPPQAAGPDPRAMFRVVG